MFTCIFYDIYTVFFILEEEKAKYIYYLQIVSFLWNYFHIIFKVILVQISTKCEQDFSEHIIFSQIHHNNKTMCLHQLTLIYVFTVLALVVNVCYC